MLEDEIVSTLAGPAAERRFTGLDNPAGAQHDRDTVSMIAVHLEGPDVVGPYVDYLEAKARALVEARWGVIEALAAELVERKALSGPAARRIMRQAALQRG